MTSAETTSRREGDRSPTGPATAESSERPRRRPARLLAAAACVFLLATTFVLGYATLFSTFIPTDDEGYFLITIKGYLGGADLYDETVGQYGPFNFELMAGLFKALGLAVTNDNARWITLALWLCTAALLAVAVHRLSRSLVLAAVTYVLSFFVLNAAPTEPAHPGHLLMLLLAGMVATAALVVDRRPRLAFALLGGLCAAALLSKVNVGCLAVGALVFAAVIASPRLLRHRVLVGAVTACFVLVPVLLMNRLAFREGFVVYAAHVTIGALAVAFVALGTAMRKQRDGGAASWLLYAAAGAAGISLVVCGIVIAQGTSLSGLVHGVLLDALKQTDSFTTALGFPGNTIAIDAVGLAIAAAVGLGALPHARPWPTVGALGRIVAGAWILAAVVSPNRLAMPVALAWVAAVPTSDDAPFPARRFVRLFVPALALLQVLHAFPVIGSQVAWSALLMVVVGAVCVGDGLRELGVTALGLGDARARLATAGAIGLAAWVLLVALVFPLRSSVSAYRAGASLGVPGAERIRLPADVAQQYISVTSTVRERCRTFVSMPGLGSLYLWTGQAPPTWRIATNWPFGFDARLQQRVVDQIEGTPGLCAVRFPVMEDWWAQGKPIPDRPLRRFILDDFHEVATIRDLVVLERNAG